MRTANLPNTMAAAVFVTLFTGAVGSGALARAAEATPAESSTRAGAYGAAGHSHHGHPAPPPPSARPRTDLGASATFDRHGRLWAVHAADGHVMLRVSPDAGRHWQPPIVVNSEPEVVAADGDNRPKLAVGPDNRLYVSWTQPGAQPYTGNVRLAAFEIAPPTNQPVMLPAAKLRVAPHTVHADRQEITHRFDALAVTSQGDVVVAWIDKRDQVAAKAAGEDYRGAAVYFAVSRDGGQHFDGDRRLAEHSCECCRIALRPQANGQLAVMWRHVFPPNVRDHALARIAADGTVSAITRATDDGWRIDACPHHGPSLAEDGRGRLHAVWFTQGMRGSGVFYGRLGEQGMEAVQRVGDAAAAHADLAADGERLAIAWKAFDGTRTRLRARRSDDGGEHWRDIELGATEGPSGQPQVLTHGGRFHVFWHTRETPLRVEELP